MNQVGEMDRAVALLVKGGYRLDDAERMLQRAFLIAVLRETRANVCQAAKILGEHRNTTSRRIEMLLPADWRKQLRASR